jgi:hypothetical protein
VSGVLSTTPLYFVDFFFYLERFEVIEFGFMTLEFVVELILTPFFLTSTPTTGRYPLETFEKDDSSALITCG